MKKILINTPDFRNKGGVAQYYTVMNFITEPTIEYFNINNFGSNVWLRLLKTYQQYSKKIQQYDVAVINPSLDKKSFLRDFVFAWLALKHKKELIVFWHGWTDSFEEKIKTSSLYKKILHNTFAKATKTIVLSKVFSNKLKALGVQSDFYIETMPISKDWINEFNIEDKKMNDQVNIVFLSRIVRAKGVYNCVDAVKPITAKNENVFLHIAGDGPDLNDLKEHVHKNKIQNIIFHGDVRGKTKTDILLNGNLFFFPTQYGEGFPNVIIEALFFGMPVISRPVAAIPEIIEQGKTGYLTDSTTAAPYTKIIEDYLHLSEEEKNKMAIACHRESKEKYSILKTKKRVIDILEKQV